MESQSKAMLSGDDMYYSDINKSGKRIFDENEAVILSCLNEALESHKCTNTITLADYGTADGGNILPLLNRLIEYIKNTKGQSQEINIFFEDQCFNDFNALVKNFMGIRLQEGLHIDGNVHVFMSATSMYNQCLPSESLDFGFSVYATHWLSVSPTTTSEGIIVANEDSPHYISFQSQAKKDWRNFVLNRGKELKSGGFFFLSSARTGSFGKLSNAGNIYKQMIQDGITTDEEYCNTKVDIFVERKVEDYTYIFSNTNEDQELMDLGLELVSCNPRTREYWPYNLSQTASEDYASERATGLCLMIKSWMYNSIRGGLSKRRSDEEKNIITDTFFDRLRDYILSEGPDFRYIHPMVDIVFKKK